MQSITKFEVDFKGSETSRRYQGLFTVKVKTSHRDTITEDQVRRGILGSNPQDAGVEALRLAGASAYLAVRLVGPDFPPWWKDSNGGMDAEDANVLVEVNNAAVKAIEAEMSSLSKEAEAALKRLRETTPEEDK